MCYINKKENLRRNQTLHYPLIFNKYIQKNLPASRALSHCAQLASLASLSAPRARDSIVALRARSCALRIHLSLFLIF